MSSRHSNSSCCSLLDDASMADLSNADWDIPFHEEGLDMKGNLTPSMSSDECINSKKCIAYNDCIVKLLKAAIGDTCKKCGKPMTIRQTARASCLVCIWECSANKSHPKGRWASQPQLCGMYACNLLIPTCLLLSGNNYAKVALLAKFLNLGFVEASNFYRY